jgi:hypothetical protein
MVRDVQRKVVLEVAVADTRCRLKRRQSKYLQEGVMVSYREPLIICRGNCGWHQEQRQAEDS